MYLFELFDDGGDMKSQLVGAVMDHLTPMVSHDVESVPVQDIQDNLSSLRTGLVIDRSLVMQILDPVKIKLIKKIEGDTVYLDIGKQEEPLKSEMEAESQKEHIHKTAQKAAKDRINR